MYGFKVYLAGPIRGLTYSASEDWREYVKDQVPISVKCYSPLRAKEFLNDGRTINTSYPELGPLATSKGIMSRDHYDCFSSDAIFCNLIGAEVISAGTVMEIAWAFAYKKPLICCIDERNIHDHPMIMEAINFPCGTLDEGIDTLKKVLLP